MSSDLTFTFSGDSSSLLAALNDIKSSVASTKQAATGLASGLKVAFAAMGTAVAGSFLAINAAAERETLTTAFIPLLGSLDAAKERMAELAQFASTTPFEMNEAAQASKVLQSLTNGALATGDGLRLVGDVASSTNTPFAEIAVTIGRLYAGLDSGRPVGEAVARLQELGAISPNVRTKLEDLQKAGQKGNAVWQVAAQDLGRFSSAMELQSATWNGKISTMRDAWNELLVTVGQPLMTALAPALDALISTFEGLQSSASEFGEGLGTVFTQLAQGLQAALSVAVPLAEGIVSIAQAMGGADTIVKILAGSLVLASLNMIKVQFAAAKTSASVIDLQRQLLAIDRLGWWKSLLVGFNRISAGSASALASIRANALSMRSVWSVTMTTMSIVTRTACVAIKAALISTGIGLIIFAIGEALSSLYTWWNKNKEAAKQAAEAAKSYKQSMDGFYQQANSLKTEEERLTLMKQMEDELERVNALRKESQEEGNDKLSQELENQAISLTTHLQLYKDILPQQIKQAEAEERKAQALKRQNEEMEQLKKHNEEAAQQLVQMAEQEEARQQEKQLSQIASPEKQIEARLDAVGLNDAKQLEEEMENLYSTAKHSYHIPTTDEEVARYKQLLATQKAITELEEKASQEKQKQRDETEKAKLDYDAKVKLLNAEISGNEKRIAQIKEEQRLTQLTAQYRAQGFANAEAMAQNIVNLERLSAEEKAKRDEAANAQQQPSRRASQSFITDSKAAVGGGGQSVLVGDTWLSESKQQNKTLIEIRDKLKKQPSISVKGNVEAVLS